MQPYDTVTNMLGKWPNMRWKERRDDLALGIIDFRQVPNFISTAESNVMKPYFQSFIGILKKQSVPGMTDPPAWMWICRDKHATSQIVHYAEEKLLSKYTLGYSDYVPCQNERLEDKSSSHRSLKAKATLLFLLKKGLGVSDYGKKIPTEFSTFNHKIYQKPGKYSELKYWMSSNELHMEFYSRIVQMFCKPGDSLFSVCARGKPLCAGMMNLLSLYLVEYYDDADKFKRVVALSRNLDMLDFAHNAYAVNEEDFSIKAKKTDEGSSRGKKKVAEVFDSVDEAHEDLANEDAELSENKGESGLSGSQSAALIVGRSEAEESPLGNNPKLMFMMQMLAKQGEQMQQMQLNAA